MPNWVQILNEIAALSHPEAFDTVRRKYVDRLYQHTGRNIISYYSAFLSKPDLAQLDIIDEDKNGFMMAIHQMDRTKGLDLILHTPGGNIAATQSIVNYLHKMFRGNIRAIIPQIAMSAGTMIACSCRAIFMGTHSNLGPIDPQLRGLPAYGVIEEFKRAVKEIKANQMMAVVWQPILNKYHPTFLGECQNAIDWSNDFVQQQLEKVMFKNKPDRQQRAKKVVRELTNYEKNKGHDRHLHYEDCRKIGLNVKAIERDPEFQDLVLTVHHCYMHSLMNTPTFKIIENHLGVAFAKQQMQRMMGMPMQMALSPAVLQQPPSP
jgi:ATP-dependent protease ClpP protease subunit